MARSSKPPNRRQRPHALAAGAWPEPASAVPVRYFRPSLRYWRVQRALHQEELAERAHVSMAALWRLEVGQAATLETARKLAAALRIEPAELMRRPLAE